MVTFDPHSRQVEQKVRHRALDKVMKRLGIEIVVLRGKDVKLVVHYNLEGKLVGGGRVSWLTALQSYALKLHPAINNICKEPIEKFEAIKEALEKGFEYLDHPLAYKYVKD